MNLLINLFSYHIKVKVLGVLAMIDSGELDWKIIAINSEDELAKGLNDVNDVENKCPGVISGKFPIEVVRFLKIYI